MKRLFFITAILSGIFAQGQIDPNAPKKFYTGVATDSLFALGDTIHVKDVLDLGNKKITNLSTPDNDGEAANKKYVDTEMQERVLQLNTIAELEAYTGESTAILVKDSLRGGMFTKKQSGIVDNTFLYAGVNGVWQRLVSKTTPVNVLWNPNIDNTDQLSDRLDLLQVYNAALSYGHTEVFHPEGFYYMDSTLVAPPNLHYYGAGKETILSFKGNGYPTGFYSSGNFEIIGHLSDPADENDRYIIADQTFSLKENDLIAISDTTSGSYIDGYRDGEFLTVKEDVDSDTIFVNSPIFSEYTADNTIISKIEKNTIEIDNMTIIGERTPPPSAGEKYDNIILELKLLQNVKVHDLTLYNVNSKAVQFSNIYNGAFNDNEINQTYSSTGDATRYGFILASCQKITIENNKIYADRHAVDVNVFARDDMQDELIYAISRNIHVHGNVLTSINSRALNMHIGEYTCFKDNLVYGCITMNGDHNKAIGNTVKTITNSPRSDMESGITIEFAKGTNSKVVGNTVTVLSDLISSHGGIRIAAIYDYENMDSIVPVEVSNNTIVMNGNAHPIHVMHRINDSISLYISSNTIINSTDDQLDISFEQGLYKNITIKDNYIENTSVQIRDFDYANISDNIFRRNDYLAIKSNDFNKLNITGNDIESNILTSATPSENSVFDIDTGNILLINQNIYDSNENTFLLNIQNTDTLVKGAHYRSSGTGDINKVNLSNEFGYKYFMNDLVIDGAGAGAEFLKINSTDGQGRLLTFYKQGIFVGGIDYSFNQKRFSFDVTNASGQRVGDAFVVQSENNNNFVGIGTGYPTTELDVDGVITASGGNSTLWNNAPLLHEQTITSTELQNIGTTAVELIPSAGNNKIIVVERVVAKMEAQTTTYDFTNGLQMVYDTFSDAIAVFNNTFTNSILDAYSTIDGGSVPAHTNAGVYLESVSDPTQGDGILHLKIYYRIVEF